MSIAIAFHVFAAVVWVGGMFFALLVLRPAAGGLEPPERLPLWGRVFSKFFPWVWCAVLLLMLSGYWMLIVHWGGFKGLPIYLHYMHGIGWLMVFVYLHLWFAPYKRFKKSLATGALPEAAKYLNQIRWMVTLNLVLGLLNSLIGASGKYW